MKKSSRITPEGTRDILFEQCEIRRKIEKTLSKLFQYRGFREVKTPGLEFYDVFHSSSAYFPQESMYKLSDSKGRLLVVRPDCTIPIARLTATKLSSLPKPLYLYYDQYIYRNNPVMRGSSDEILQMGVELIGTDSAISDVEMLELAAKCFQACGIEDFRLEICPIQFFKNLIEQLDASEEEKESIRLFIESKNYAALTEMMECFPQNSVVVALQKLPQLFGSKEVIEQAISLTSDPNTYKALINLREIYSELKKLDLSGKVLVDLGLVNQAEYYTGIIFRGYIEGIGEPVISGGRYDYLMGDFGESQPATGFGINIDSIAKALLRTQTPPQVIPKYLVHPEDVSRYSDVLKEVNTLVSQQICCRSSVFSTVEEARKYAANSGIPVVRVVGKEKKYDIQVFEGEGVQ